MSTPFTTAADEIGFLERKVADGSFYPDESGNLLRKVMGYPGPVWIKDSEGLLETKWGRGNLTLEGQELVLRELVATGCFRRPGPVVRRSPNAL
jgi:hypothetical protein